MQHASDFGMVYKPSTMEFHQFINGCRRGCSISRLDEKTDSGVDQPGSLVSSVLKRSACITHKEGWKTEIPTIAEPFGSE